MSKTSFFLNIYLLEAGRRDRERKKEIEIFWRLAEGWARMKTGARSFIQGSRVGAGASSSNDLPVPSQMVGSKLNWKWSNLGMRSKLMPSMGCW